MRCSLPILTPTCSDHLAAKLLAATLSVHCPLPRSENHGRLYDCLNRSLASPKVPLSSPWSRGPGCRPLCWPGAIGPGAWICLPGHGPLPNIGCPLADEDSAASLVPRQLWTQAADEDEDNVDYDRDDDGGSSVEGSDGDAVSALDEGSDFHAAADEDQKCDVAAAMDDDWSGDEVFMAAA